MSIQRVPRPESNFYILDKQISGDRKLSWAARGLLIYLLGKPDNWKISVASLISETQESARPAGRDAVYAILKELQVTGYIRKIQAIQENGAFEPVDYLVSESPLTDYPEAAEPLTAEPLTAEPLTAEPLTANPRLPSIDVNQVLTLTKDREAPAVPLSVDKSSKTENQTAVALPPHIDQELWKGFMEIRADKKVVNSTSALKLIIKELNLYHQAGYDVNRVIEASIRNSWNDVYPPAGYHPPASASARLPTVPKHEPELTTEQRAAAGKKALEVLKRFGRPGAAAARSAAS